MSEKTNIEWCDSTWNPWEGCQKVGPGCDHCYAEARNARYGGGTAVNWGPGAPRRRTSSANWRKPVAWNAAHESFFAEHGRRQRVFCASLADVFDNAVDPMWRADLFDLIQETPNLDWLLLTKRIVNVQHLVKEAHGDRLDIVHIGTSWLPENVWLGATIVNQEEADRDIPKLLAIPVAKRFLSMEPLLGPVDLTHVQSDHNGRINALEGWYCDDGISRVEHTFIDWVIVGGESGPHARPMHPDWARDLRDQCASAGVPFLFKQIGEWAYCDIERQRSLPARILADRANHVAAWPDGTVGYGNFRLNGGPGLPLFRIGKKAAGRVLDGVTHDAFPGVAA